MRGHETYSVRTRAEPPEQPGQAQRPRRCEQVCIVRQPLAHLGRLVVDDIVDSSRAVRDRRDRRRGRVLDVDEGVDAVPSRDDRDASALHVVREIAVAQYIVPGP